MDDHYIENRVKNNVHIAFVTDGEFAQVLGIACIINSLILDVGVKFDCQIWILAPEENLSEVSNLLTSFCCKVSFKYLSANTHDDDKYYIQLGLAQLFELLDYDDTVICLDYDHVILNSRAFPFVIPNLGILVSSEASYDITNQLIPRRLGSNKASLLPKVHLNISLICGRATELCRVGRYWLGAYSDLSPYISVRHRVEIAFSLAAEKAGINPIPCSASVQGNFAVPYQRCCLFHYGGESEKANYMKSVLYREASKMRKLPIGKNDICQLSNLIAQELLNLISN